MNTRTAFYIQAIRGPVLLVTVGVLFAIHQAGGLSFSRTWPLLVIVIGIMKLLERMWAPPVAPSTNPAAFDARTGRPAGVWPSASQTGSQAGTPPYAAPYPSPNPVGVQPTAPVVPPQAPGGERL